MVVSDFIQGRGCGMGGSPLGLLEVAPVAIAVVVAIWHVRAVHRAPAAEDEERTAPHA